MLLPCSGGPVIAPRGTLVRAHYRGRPPEGEQIDLFAPGRQAKERGQRRALTHADLTWRALAEAAIEHLANQRRPFTTDQVWELVPVPPEGTSPNTLGSLITAAARAGTICWTGGFAKSTRPMAHHNLLRTWMGGQPGDSSVAFGEFAS